MNMKKNFILFIALLALSDKAFSAARSAQATTGTLVKARDTLKISITADSSKTTDTKYASTKQIEKQIIRACHAGDLEEVQALLTTHQPDYRNIRKFIEEIDAHIDTLKIHTDDDDLALKRKITACITELRKYRREKNRAAVNAEILAMDEGQSRDVGAVNEAVYEKLLIRKIDNQAISDLEIILEYHGKRISNESLQKAYKYAKDNKAKGIILIENELRKRNALPTECCCIIC